MFASPVPKAKTKKAAHSVNELARQRSPLAIQHLGRGDGGDRADISQRSSGDPAPLRLLRPGHHGQGGNRCAEDNEHLANQIGMPDRQHSAGMPLDFGRIAIFPHHRARRPLAPSPIGNLARPIATQPMQTKLAVGRADDPPESEADRIAEQVMRMPDTKTSVAAAPPHVSKCAACDQPGTLPEMLMTKPASSAEAGEREVPALVYRVLRSPGRLLDAPSHAFFEPRFGHDFSTVRVHADAPAAESARQVNALAYTVGRDIVFGRGQYSPGTTEG